MSSSSSSSSLPILLICGCQKYKASLLTAITRMKHDAYTIIGIVGTSEPTSFDGTILSLCVEDTYEFLPKKIHTAFTWIHANYTETCGIFKTDDDIFFGDQNHLAHEILHHCKTPYWGVITHSVGGGDVPIGRIMNSCEDKSIRATYQRANYCWGLGYWISRDAIPIVCASEEYKKSFLEDVCMGYVMNAAGFQPYRVDIAYREVPRQVA